MSDDTPEIRALASRRVYANRWMRVREDTIERRDGSTGIYGVIEKSDFVVIVPMEDDGALHLVEQYRYPVGARFWEFPQGTWEHAPDADPLDMARGELREETGLDAARMTYVGRLFQAYGYATQACNIYLAEGLRAGERALDPEEQGLISRRFPLAEVVAMIDHGVIRDAASVAAFGLLRLKNLLPA